MKKAFLSALGMMGRRHLKGLLQAGFEVHALDIHGSSESQARADIKDLGVDQSRLSILDECPGGVSFDVAIFSEPASWRFDNYSRFLKNCSSPRILLEKPMSADPGEVLEFLRLAREKGIEEAVQVNFIRRHWDHVHLLKDYCAQEEKFSVTLNGGAVGLGCMGIHYLDTFVALSDEEIPKVTWSELSAMSVASGRGAEFQDFGGDFVLSGSRGRLLASFEADSSSNVLMSVRGRHFLAQVDYTDMTYKIAARNPDSDLPFYRYGADYKVSEEGKISIPSMDAITQDWALGQRQLPGLEYAVNIHNLLHDVLLQGGAQPPYKYT